MYPNSAASFSANARYHSAPAPTPQPPTVDKVKCPNCRAVQEWSDTCRRCKSDLTLLWGVKLSADDAKHRCLEALYHGDYLIALDHAKQNFRIAPNQDAARLLSVCSILCGSWTNALQYAQIGFGETS